MKQILKNRQQKYVEKNYKNVQWINALSKYDDDVSNKCRDSNNFYLQLDDDDNSIILISYDKRKENFFICPI